MLELLIIVGVGAAAATRVTIARRAALQRARLRAEAVLDELAAAACDALAGGADPSTSRRCARAVDRYERTRDRVAQARTRRELDSLVARYEMRRDAVAFAERGLARLRSAPGMLVRR